MQQVTIVRYGPPDVLRLQTRPDPIPADGEIRVAVRAAGVNFADILARLGVYPDAPKPPMVVGYEVSGVVDAVGPAVAAFRPGDDVIALTRFGGYADRVIVPAGFAFRLPPSIDHVTGAAIPVNYLTAFLALYRCANLAAGETVLVHGAAGGVGIAATQLARLRRATVIGTASTEKHPAIRANGVDHPLDYRLGSISADVRRLTNGRGADVVLDPLGGRSFADSYRLLAPLGRLVVYGVSRLASGQRRSVWRVLTTLWQMPRFHPLSLMNRNRGVFGLNVGHLWDERDRLADAMDQILQDVAAGLIRPIIARTFRLEDAADAHRFLQSRSNTGKVVLTTT